jgi:hypothetical protein
MSDNATVTNRTATVHVRSENESLEDFVGMTVDQIREEFSLILNIPADASARLRDGSAIDDDYVVQAGDEIVFSLVTGQKG